MRSLSFDFLLSSCQFSPELLAHLTTCSGTPHPKDTSRTTLVGDVPVIMRHCEQLNDGAFLMDFTRIRNIASQPLSDLAGNEDKLNFSAADKRPAEYTVVVFDPESSVVLLHDHPHGLSASMLARYLMGQAKGPTFRFAPILNGDAAARLAQAGGFSKFTVKLAAMGDVAILKNYGLSQNELLELIPFYQAPSISVVMQAGAKKKSLALEKIRTLANALMALPKKHVKTLTLVASDVGEEFPINLLKDRIVYREELSKEDAAEVTHEVRYRAARNAWGAHQYELRARYNSHAVPSH